MTVKELKEKLRDLPDEFEVKMCNDEYSMIIAKVEVAPQDNGSTIVWLSNDE